MAGRDLIGKASTGSGKTLAFGVPILESYLADLPTLNGESKGAKTDQDPKPAKDRRLTALIISPTRELAHQITKHLENISYGTDLKIVTITGGLSLQKQTRLLSNGVDVIVATPGRLWEIVSEGRGWIDKLRDAKMLILDEADRVLEEGHFKEVTQLLDLMDENVGEAEESDDEEDAKARIQGEQDVRLKAKRKREKKANTPVVETKSKKKKRQTLVFSATFHKGLQQKLAGKGKKQDWQDGELLGDKASMEYLLKKLRFGDKNPKWVDVNPISAIADKVKEGIVECGAMEKVDPFSPQILPLY